MHLNLSSDFPLDVLGDYLILLLFYTHDFVFLDVLKTVWVPFIGTKTSKSQSSTSVHILNEETEQNNSENEGKNSTPLI